MGRVQVWGGPIREVRAGDVVWFDPGVKHWHGAAPTVSMVHIAMQEAKDGKYVDWQEHVTDAQYGAAVGGSWLSPISDAGIRFPPGAELGSYRRAGCNDDRGKTSALKRLYRATLNTLRGFAHAFRSEQAFRQEVALLLLGLPIGIFVAPSAAWYVAMIGVLLV